MAILPLLLCALICCWSLPLGLCALKQKSLFGINQHSISPLSKNKFSIKFIEQKIDHFSFTNNDTYQMRYLTSIKFWKSGGPIFFYTGNEGDIIWFSQNTGFMWDIAPQFGAMLIFAEHRYYGKSLPYGQTCCKDVKKLGYLTSEQALADYVELIAYIRNTVDGAKNSPVIVFGGSYGGMLSAWFRIKYPHVVQGAIAASAPILQFTGLTPCEAFDKVVTNDFMTADKRCPDIVRSSTKTIRDLGKTSDGLRKVQGLLNICDPLNSADEVIGWLEETWTSLAMVNYPYPANFLMPLPAWPVKETCKLLLKESDPLTAVGSAISVYYNYTGEAGNCYNLTKSATSKLGGDLWDFQACSEMVMPMCSDGKSDMFEPSQWSLSEYTATCQKNWNVTPEPYWTQRQYGGRNALKTASNIVFSNGLLDPWSSGGVTNFTSGSVTSVVIPEGAHHLDLRAANPLDPPSVKQARILEILHISKWIVQWNESSTDT